MLGRRFHSIPGKGFCGYMALAHELQISAGAVFPLLRTCIVSEQGATDPDIRSSLQTITSAEGEWLAQAARGVPEDRRNCLDKPGMFFCSDWARPVAMWLGVPVLLVADTGDFDSHTCQVCRAQVGGARVTESNKAPSPTTIKRFVLLKRTSLSFLPKKL